MNHRLRQLRRSRGWTQEQLAERLGTNAVNISRWENGNFPGPYYIGRLCEAFGVGAAELGLLANEEPGPSPDTSTSSPARAPAEMTTKSSTRWPPALPHEQYYHLPGREADLARLLAIFQDPAGAPVVALDGLGGLGKTALATELARRILRLGLFTGVIGESARQEILVGGEIVRLSEATLTFEQLLNSLARQLECWEFLTLETAEKQSRLTQLLHQHHYLLLVDNLESSENAQGLVWHLRSLLGNSRALITSRLKTLHDFVFSHSLKGLEFDDTVLFLQQDAATRGGVQWQSIPQEKLLAVQEITGGAPLALKLLGSQARLLGLDRALAQIQHAGNQLYSFLFRQSWGQLSPTAQRVLIYIGQTTVSDIGWEELLEAGLAPDEQALTKAVDQLVISSLLDIHSNGSEISYTLHQLTRQFVASDLPAIWREQGLL